MWDTLPPELQRCIWCALVGDPQGNTTFSFVCHPRWWAHWRGRHHRAVLARLWGPVHRPARLALSGRDAPLIRAWERWWPRQAGRWEAPLPPTACPLARLCSRQLVLCRVGDTLWVGRVRGMLCSATRVGTLRKVGLGGWSLVQVGIGEPRWWRGSECRACAWCALPRSESVPRARKKSGP